MGYHTASRDLWAANDVRSDLSANDLFTQADFTNLI